MGQGEMVINAEKADKRHSVMSLEHPVSPTSSSGDSIAESVESNHYNHDYPETVLTPHISHTSSAHAIGGHAPITLYRSKSHRSARSVATTATSTDPAFEVDFTESDPGDPQQWTLLRKCTIVAVMSYATTVVVLYSTSYTSAIPGMAAEFGIDELSGVLGMTTYLIGIACGSLVLAPLSEMYGRRPIYIGALALFILFVLPCALAQNMATILVMRFFGAFCAAAMISNSPGTVNDIVDEEHRALAYSVWSIGPLNGPVIGPVVGGFVYEYLGWRWTNWVVIIGSGAALVLVALIPETYAPVLLRKRAAKLRKEEDTDRYWSRYDEKTPFVELLKINLSRPFVMTVKEPILIFWDIYIALVYGILYLSFVAYPIVFSGLRGWDSGITGLAFSGIGIGSLIVIAIEPLIRKAINMHTRDPETGRPPPEAGVSVVCVAAVLLPVGELWFAWTCTPNVHWIVPILAGIPFGMGNAGVFIYASNYLVHSYGIYAASALAGNAVLRSVMGAVLPLAGTVMYNNLGANWAGTILGLLESVCIPIPFIFYKYGYRIRQKSTLIRQMDADRRRLESKRAKAEAKAVKRAEGEAMAGFAMGTAAAMDEEVDLEKAAMSHHHVHQRHAKDPNVSYARRSSMETVDLTSKTKRRGSMGSVVVP
ncbi:hypothetical protein AMS68_005522 [Peltaster fructicola]|uniref:Major facilitator superfamily (MFS) profile domain-containing protein n=1 Tax=Peltaster fructicola TaxID=286661 RepID=A0A6H0XZA8_9PEZI|nr:hypothetical protein AMS68_005522 [Peltaster fructicola]